MPSSRNASPTSLRSEAARGAAAGALARKLAFAPVLVLQALCTRRHALVLPEAGGARSGVLGSVDAGPEPALRLLIAGDSSAAGVGVARQDQAVAGHLVRGLHATTGRVVTWALHARSGLTTRGVHALLAGARPVAADVAVVITGVNDVVDQVTTQRAVAHRAALADWLLDEGLVRHVAFAQLPPVHEFPLRPEPLRRVLGDDARRHDAALSRWAAMRPDVSHAVFPVHLDAADMAADGFHPGEPVYRVCGDALAAHVARVVTAMQPAASQAVADPPDDVSAAIGRGLPDPSIAT